MNRSGVRYAVALVALFSSSAALAQSCEEPPVQHGLRLLLIPPERGITACPPPPCPSLAECVERARQACVGTGQGARILGDIVTMRDPKAITLTDKAAARALATAYLSQDAATAESILAPFENSSDAATRYLARLALLQIRLRSGTSPAAVMAELDAMSTDQVPFSTADIEYLRSLGHASAGRDEEASDAAARALAIEGNFFNARLQHLRSSLKRMARNLDSPRACQADLQAVTESLYALMQLAPCPIQAAYVDAAFELDAPVAAADPADMLTRVALASLSANRRAVAARVAVLRSAVEASAAGDACLSRMLGEAEAIDTRAQLATGAER